MPFDAGGLCLDKATWEVYTQILTFETILKKQESQKVAQSVRGTSRHRVEGR